MEIPTDLVRKKFTSRQGKEYEVVYSAKGGTDNREVQTKAAVGEPSSDEPNACVHVNWPVEPDEWKKTPPDVHDATGITEYNLHHNDDVTRFIWPYKLEIRCDGKYDYHFHDESGDSYEILAIEPGHHMLHYGSPKPTIISIGATKSMSCQ